MTEKTKSESVSASPQTKEGKEDVGLETPTAMGEATCKGFEAPLDEIYTISLWQPWATWILWGWKIIETRTHDRFRHLVGHRIGIHAAQKFDRDWYMHASRFMSEEKFCKTRDFEHVKGAVLCTAQVVDHCRVRHLNSPEAMIECETPRYGLFLERIIPVEPPLIVKGRQGIFKVRPVC